RPRPQGRPDHPAPTPPRAIPRRTATRRGARRLPDPGRDHDGRLRPIGAAACGRCGARGLNGVAAMAWSLPTISTVPIGVNGSILVPGLLLLGVEPRVAAPLSLLLQVIVIPLGATSHAAVGNVQRSIALPLIVGGVIGSVTGALLASTVQSAVTARVVAAVIV